MELSKFLEGTDFSPVYDGSFHRFNRDGTLNGWFIGHIEGENRFSRFGDWRENTSYLEVDSSLPIFERNAILNKINEKISEETKKKHEDTKNKVSHLWTTYQDGISPYLTKKGFKDKASYIQCKLYNETLVVPLRDEHGTLHSVQFIAPDGKKQFKSGGKTQGHYHSIGPAIKDTIYITEGIATALTVAKATNTHTIVAFSAHNLLPVTQTIRKLHPSVKIVIAADNDQFTLTPIKNPGLTAAKKAAKLTNATVIYPEFQDTSQKPTDFNDLMNQEGMDTVKRVLLPEAIKNTPKNEPEEEEFTHFFELSKKAATKKPFLVEGLLGHGHVSMVVGDPKRGKSTILRQLALDISRGNPFLGRFKTLKKPVTIFSFEDSPQDAAQHLVTLGGTINDDIFVYNRFTPDDILKKLEQDVVKRGSGFVIVDTLGRAGRGVNPKYSINNYDDMEPLIDSFRQICRKYDMNIIFTHHKTKGGATNGSVAIEATLDTIIDFNVTDKEKRSNIRDLLINLSRYEMLDNLYLDFNEKDKKYFIHEDQKPSKARAGKPKKSFQEVSSSIMELIKESPQGLTAPQIVEFNLEHVPKNVSRLRGQLDWLVKNEYLTSVGSGSKIEPKIYSIGHKKFKEIQPDLDFEE